MKKLFATVAFAAALTSTACVFRATPVGIGIDVTNTDFNTLTGLKEGKSCITTIFGFPVARNMSLVEAAKAGGISKVKMVDYERKIGFIVNSQCIVAYGE